MCQNFEYGTVARARVTESSEMSEYGSIYLNIELYTSMLGVENVRSGDFDHSNLIKG